MPTLSLAPVLVQSGDPSHGSPEPDTSTADDLRVVFVGQARLLADRLDLGYGLDFRSLRNLIRVAVALVIAEQRA
jgi:hypothetical protein